MTERKNGPWWWGPPVALITAAAIYWLAHSSGHQTFTPIPRDKSIPGAPACVDPETESLTEWLVTESTVKEFLDQLFDDSNLTRY